MPNFELNERFLIKKITPSLDEIPGKVLGLANEPFNKLTLNHFF